MVMLDTSEFMRNGDYFPTRLIAAQDAVMAVFRGKTRDNPENTVGLMTLGGSVKVSFVRDTQKFQAAVRDTRVDTMARPFTAAVQVALLALRHRQNVNQRQRVVAVVGSPVGDSDAELARLAARMRKNGIALDIVCIGQEGVNSAKLHQFVTQVESGGNSHFLDVHPSSAELEEVISRSAICSENNTGFAGGDLDLADDPELAMALRMSLEEERQRQARVAGEAS